MMSISPRYIIKSFHMTFLHRNIRSGLLFCFFVLRTLKNQKHLCLVSQKMEKFFRISNLRIQKVQYRNIFIIEVLKKCIISPIPQLYLHSFTFQAAKLLGTSRKFCHIPIYRTTWIRALSFISAYP